MKKIVSIALVLIMALSLVALTACGGEETTATTRFGLGIVTAEGAASDFEAADPTDEDSKDKKGSASATYTACVITLDADGKITSAKFDAFEGKVEYDGTGVGTVSNLTSKYALGEAYGMKAYAGSTLEWFEQADAFAAKLVGKTESEIASLMSIEGETAGKGTADLIAAGCTIYVSDFVKAAQAAYANAKTATAIEGGAIAITVTSTKEITNATADANGTAVITTVIEGTCGTAKTTVTYTATAGFTAAGVAGGEKITIAQQ